MYSSLSPEFLAGKVRVHGVDIPFMGASVDFGVNIPSQATIHVAPVKEAKDIRPHTMIHLFYRDHYSSLVCGKEVYRLWFEGHVVGRSFQRAEGERSIAFHCVDFSNYFIHAKQYFLDFSQGNFLGAADAAILSGVSKLSGSLLGTEGEIAKLFEQSKGRRFDYIVMQLIEKVATVNPYFDYHLKRLNMKNKIYSASTEAMTSAMFNHQLFFNFLKSQLKKQGGTQSIWAVLTMLLGMIHHDIISVPTPSFISRADIPNASSAATTGVSVKSRAKEEETAFSQGVGQLWTQSDIRKKTLGWKSNASSKFFTPEAVGDQPYGPNQLMIKPNAWMLEPPMCNVVFPNEITTLSFTENWQQKPTRLQFVPFHPLLGQSQLQQLMAIYQPDDLHQFIRKNYASLQKVVKDVKQRAAAAAERGNRDFHFITDEELERGIIPSLSNILPGATSILTSLAAKQGANAQKFKRGSNEFLHRLAEYEFQRQRAASDTFGCSIAWKPHLIAGHPILFLDDSPASFDIMATVMSGRHTLMASGAASTSIQCAMPRELSETVVDLTEVDLRKVGGGIGLVSSEPPLPEWFDASYQHGKIGLEVYSRSIGCLGLLNGGFKTSKNVDFRYARPGLVRDEGGARLMDKSDINNHQTEVRVKMLQAADSLKKDYHAAKLAGSDGYYTWIQTFRPIVTEEQLFEGHYSGSLVGAKSYFSDHADAQDRRFTKINANVFLDIQLSPKESTGTPDSSPKTKPIAEMKKVEKSVAVPIADQNKRFIPPTGKTGEDFLKKAIEIAKLPDGRFCKYVWGAIGPAQLGYDCSGLPYAVAKAFNMDIEKHSLDMYRFSCASIDVEQAFKIKGAILFTFQPARRGMPNARDIKHVGISMGDGVHVFEAYNVRRGVGIFKRAKKSIWTHAGLLYGVKYDNAPIFTNVTVNQTPFDQYYSSVSERIERINDIRIKKAIELQRALNARIAFEG